MHQVLCWKGWQSGPIRSSSDLCRFKSGVKVYIELFACFSFMCLMSASSSSFNQWFTCFLDPEQTWRHWFRPKRIALFVCSAVLKCLILFPAELGIWLVPPPHSPFQTEVSKKPLFWRNSCCFSGKKSWSWNGCSKKMSPRRAVTGKKANS